MKFLARASTLFLGLRVAASYHQELQVSEEKVAQLKVARREIRDAIRTAGTRIKFEDAFWEPEFATRARAARPLVEPRFKTQGSLAYDLLVAPCQAGQQIDLDDGMYVVVDYLKNGRPALVAKALFAMVQEALAPLCLRRGWKLVEKQTCVRVVVNPEAHIDIPIYSAPRDLVEVAEQAELPRADMLPTASQSGRAGLMPSFRLTRSCSHTVTAHGSSLTR